MARDCCVAHSRAATDIPIHALNKLPYAKLDSAKVGVKEGVIFLTYSSLIASSDRVRPCGCIGV